MNKLPIILSGCFVLVSVLLGGTMGGLAGYHCETCSADFSRLYIGAGATGAAILGAGIYQAWQKRWIRAATMAILLLPAAYYSAVLAQKVGLWWDRL